MIPIRKLFAFSKSQSEFPLSIGGDFLLIYFSFYYDFSVTKFFKRFLDC